MMPGRSAFTRMGAELEGEGVEQTRHPAVDRRHRRGARVGQIFARPPNSTMPPCRPTARAGRAARAPSRCTRRASGSRAGWPAGCRNRGSCSGRARSRTARARAPGRSRRARPPHPRPRRGGARGARRLARPIRARPRQPCGSPVGVDAGPGGASHHRAGTRRLPALRLWSTRSRTRPATRSRTRRSASRRSSTGRPAAAPRRSGGGTRSAASSREGSPTSCSSRTTTHPRGADHQPLRTHRLPGRARRRAHGARRRQAEVEILTNPYQYRRNDAAHTH